LPNVLPRLGLAKLVLTVLSNIYYNIKSNVVTFMFTAIILVVLLLLSSGNYLYADFINCDAPRAWGLYFQDSASPQMEALVELHDDIMYYLVAILFSVA
jgi:hypothetical protein